MQIRRSAIGLLEFGILILTFQPSALADGPPAIAVIANSTDPSIMPVTRTTWENSKWHWIFISKLKLDDTNTTQSDGTITGEIAENDKLTWFQLADTSGKTDTFPAPTVQDATHFSFSPLVAYNPDREFWKKGETVLVVYIEKGDASCSGKPQIAFDEKARKTAFESGLSQLTSSWTQRLAGLTAADHLCAYVSPYLLAQDRADLAVTVTPPSANKSDAATATIVTGSPEHLFFTTDVLIKNASEVKYDSTNKTLALKDAPNNPMVGLNVMIGDPYKSYDDFTWDRLAFKVMASASTPKDVYGAGVGYLFKNHVFNTDAKNAGAFMLFFGYIRTRGDNGIFTHSWRAGLSFNLNSLSSQ